MCRPCHEALHALTGGFSGWTKAMLRAWQNRMSDRYRPRT